MAIWNTANRKEFLAALDKAQRGDCLRAEALGDVAKTAGEMLSAMGRLREKGLDLLCPAEDIDTRGESGSAVFAFSRALLELERKDRRDRQREGIDKAREEGKYRGRKPIAVDETLFDSVVALWKDGKITAREAMTRLDLKPNTFYRRIKEQEEQKMKDYKKIEKDIRTELKEAAKQSRQDLNELKKQVRAEAAEVKQAKRWSCTTWRRRSAAAAGRRRPRMRTVSGR